MEPSRWVLFKSMRRLPRVAFLMALVTLALLSLLPVGDWLAGGFRVALSGAHLRLYLSWARALLIVAAVGWVVMRVFSLLPEGRDGRTGKRPDTAAGGEGGKWAGRGQGKGPGRGSGGAPGQGPGRPATRSVRRGTAEPTRGPLAGGDASGGGSPAVRSPLRWWWPVLLLLLLPTLLYSLASRELFDSMPLHLDAMTQALQGQIFSQGRLSALAPAEPAFFSSLLMAEQGGRVFSQFTPGWAAVLAVGFLLGVPWLMGPLFTALGGYALFLLLRVEGKGDQVALLTAVVFAVAPWTVFNAGAWMNHLPTVSFILLGSAAMLRGIRKPEAWLLPGAGAACLGVATLIRPLDGVAFGLPATVWMLARGVKDPRARKGLAAFAVGGTLTVGVLLAYNWVLHGGPLTFGYHVLWGSAHDPGFHQGPWGEPHTLERGVRFLNGYLLSLQMVFFEAPAPSLLPAFVGLLLARRLSPLDRYLLAGSLLVILGYLTYWYEGHYLGPRFLHPLAPVVAIWTVRFGAVLALRTGRAWVGRWAHASVLALVVWGWALGVPQRWREYERTDPTRRVSVSALAAPQARDALILLPSSWESQVWSRLWATGLPRWEAAHVIERMGLCRLELAVSWLEREEVAEGSDARWRIQGLLGAEAPIIPPPPRGAPLDPFVDLGFAEGRVPPICLSRFEAEQLAGGYGLIPFYARLGPAWTGEGPILAQDLHEHNPRLLAAHPHRPVFRLAEAGRRGRVQEFRLVPLDADSAWAAWDASRELKEQAPVF
jgi:hypothetical protein